ncbi:streptogrisin C [Microlunatus panaciterrae]|uniref:Streptogrisin C n=1 Tax=Microlunatus panaciterrae TaxID=400768 RepID=A0ABS2RDX3_9ACTN|nr:S1 family peptidase [Microlunatus panaciterrae]MBM7797204.1 streptogrisin C [Microlunatus panaciterrae]
MSLPLPDRRSTKSLLALLVTVGMLIMNLTVGPERQATEGSVDEIGDRVVGALGTGRTGGSYLDESTGRLVVTVTDRPAAEVVRAAGLQPQLVARSTQSLDRTKGALDAFASRHGAGQVQNWYVDVVTNRLVVTSRAGATDRTTQRFLAEVRSYAPQAKIELARATVRPTKNLHGGQQVDMSDGYVCSSGFNARTTSGSAVMITAGHCAVGRPTFYHKDRKIGATIKYSFPRNDYGIVRVNTAKWKPRATVVRWDGTLRSVSGYSKAAVGSKICKSGQTSHWTCGRIKAYNQTVNYGDGQIVSGLVRYSACVEDGDSGAAVMSGSKAQGINSGAELYQKGSRWVCGSKVGEPNVSYYQPIGEVLKAYKLKLLVR